MGTTQRKCQAGNCGSSYPLSSLIRAEKYFRKGIMTRGTYIRAMLDILPAFIERGFRGWDDFKNQLDAVDLALLPEELSELRHSSLRKLFNQLNNEGVEKEDRDVADNN